jgi:hypothetical protein
MPRTPDTIRSVIRTYNALINNGTAICPEALIFAKSAVKNAIKRSLAEHEREGLQAALVDEKKRRKRGKHMGLLAPDQPGQSKFFSGAIVQAVRARKHDLEAQKAQKELDREARLLEKQAQKDRRAAEAKDRRQTRTTAQAEKQAQKQAELEARRAQKAINKQLKAEEQLHKPTKQAPTKPTKRKLSNAEPVEFPSRYR